MSLDQLWLRNLQPAKKEHAAHSNLMPYGQLHYPNL